MNLSYRKDSDSLKDARGSAVSINKHFHKCGRDILFRGEPVGEEGPRRIIIIVAVVVYYFTI
jgi:hypothetical protein